VENNQITNLTQPLKHGKLFKSEKLTMEMTGNMNNFSSIQITDVQLAIFSNIVGVLLFLLVVGYHYIAANSVVR